MSKLLGSKTFKISCSAAFAALSAIMTALPLSLPYPIIPYLKFDPSEIPVLTAFLVFGTWPGITSAITLWIILNIFGSWVPIGPAMKFAAITSMLMGVWIGSGFKNSPMEAFNSKIRGILAFILGTIMRIIVMGIFNYIIVWLICPFFLDIALKSITATTGLTINNNVDALIWVMTFTAIFNTLHTILTIIPSLTIAKIIRKIIS
ncbi:MAG: hypothetical protein QXX09_03600, partial [Candidatus Methanomethylicia archaeon]